MSKDPLHKQSEKACMCFLTRRVRTRDFMLYNFWQIHKRTTIFTQNVPVWSCQFEQKIVNLINFAKKSFSFSVWEKSHDLRTQESKIKCRPPWRHKCNKLSGLLCKWIHLKTDWTKICISPTYLPPFENLKRIFQPYLINMTSIVTGAIIHYGY